jgi:MPBQ/MSBQ methyltransferase
VSAGGSGALRFFYDRLLDGPIGREFFEESGFFNVGWWDGAAASPPTAAAALMERLTAHVPPDVGRVLDVACGAGGTTAWLARRFGGAEVVALDLGEERMGAVLVRAPRARLVCADAALLPLAPRSFDLVVCVEGAYHFRTRERFLAEAHRVLRPGGRLVLSDPAFGEDRLDEGGYRGLCHAAGFAEATAEDASARCVEPFRRALTAWAARGDDALRRSTSLLTSLPASAYLIVEAVRDAEGR